MWVVVILIIFNATCISVSALVQSMLDKFNYIKRQRINSKESLVYCVMRDKNGPYGSNALHGR